MPPLTSKPQDLGRSAEFCGGEAVPRRPTNYSDKTPNPWTMVRLTNPSPWNLPDFLIGLGPFAGTFFSDDCRAPLSGKSRALTVRRIIFKADTPPFLKNFGFSRTIVFPAP